MLKGFICAWGLSDNTIEKLRKILRLPLKGCELNTKLYIYIYGFKLAFFILVRNFLSGRKIPKQSKC